MPAFNSSATLPQSSRDAYLLRRDVRLYKNTYTHVSGEMRRKRSRSLLPSHGVEQEDGKDRSRWLCHPSERTNADEIADSVVSAFGDSSGSSSCCEGPNSTDLPVLSEKTRATVGEHCNSLTQLKADVIDSFLELRDRPESESKRRVLNEKNRARGGKNEDKVKIHETVVYGIARQQKRVIVYIKLNYIDLSWEKVQKTKFI